MQKAIQTKVTTLVTKFLNASDDLVIELHSLGLTTPAEQRPYVIVAVCEALAKGEGYSRSSDDKPMLDSKYKHYEMLKSRVRRVMDALKGDTAKKSSGKVDPVDAIIKAFNKLDAKQQRAVLKALA